MVDGTVFVIRKFGGPEQSRSRSAKQRNGVTTGNTRLVVDDAEAPMTIRALGGQFCPTAECSASEA